MEKRRKFQIVYAGLTNLCQHSTTDLVTAIMTNERKQSALSKVRSLKDSKTTGSVFVLYSIYHQRAGKTSHFHMRGGDFTHFQIYFHMRGGDFTHFQIYFHMRGGDFTHFQLYLLYL